MNNTRHKGWLLKGLAAGVLAASSPSFAQTANANEEDTLEEIVVTGSRVAGRLAADSAVAIDVVTVDDLTKNGFTQLGQSLQTLAPSFNFSRTQISDGSDLFRPATLRGLQPDQTLVLINGKRRHNQAIIALGQTVGAGAAGTDINAIPLSALKSVEVLRDGAAAQYGSDAIAGVINLQLKDTVGTSVFAQYGSTYDGDGDTFTVGVNTGFEITPSGGILNLTGEFRDADATDRSDPGAIQPNGLPAQWQIGDSDTEFFSLFANLELPVGDSGEIYAFAGYSDRDALGAGFFRDAGSAAQNVPQVFPNGFLPRIDNTAQDFSIAGGYRFDLSEQWNGDVSVAYGRNEYEFSAAETINASIAGDFLTQNPGATDAEIAANSGPSGGFARGVNFDQLTVNADIAGQLDISATGLDVLYVAAGAEYRRENFDTEAGILESFSCGINDGGIFGSVIDFAVIPQCGFQAFPGTRPSAEVDVDRDSYAIYADVETDLTERWLVTGAVRFEDFSDSGDRVTGKFTTRYDITEQFAIRGSISTGFRAPSLQQSAFTNDTTNIDADGNLASTLIAAAGSPIPVSLGVDGLDLETSVNYGIGIVFTPTDNFTLTIDAYQIDIDDRIVLGGGLTPQALIDAGQPALAASLAAALLPSNAAVASFFSNGADTQTQGIDFVASYRPAISSGSLDLTLSGNFNDTDVESINSAPGIPDDVTFASVDADFLENGQPGERLTFAANYESGKLGFLARVNYFGETELDFFGGNFIGIPGTDPTSTVEDAFLVDVEVSYNFNDNIRLALGGNNIFDETPNELDSNEVLDIITGGAARFPVRGVPYGFNGGTYYLRLSTDF